MKSYIDFNECKRITTIEYSKFEQTIVLFVQNLWFFFFDELLWDPQVGNPAIHDLYKIYI